MNEAKRTPAPFVVECCYDGSRTICQMRSADKLICVNATEGASPAGYEAAEANADLFAAAPEMLAALEAEERHQWAVRNLEAISDPLDDMIPALRAEVERTRSEANELRREAIAKAKGGQS